MLTSADGSGGGVREVGLESAAVWRKHPSVGPSEQHRSPETERTRTTDADVNASSHSDLHLIITPPQRPFVISARNRFLRPTAPFLAEGRKKRKWRFITLIFHMLWPCQWGNIPAITLMNSRLTLHRVNTTAPGWTFFLKRQDTGVFKTHIHPYQSGRLATCIKAASACCKDI